MKFKEMTEKTAAELQLLEDNLKKELADLYMQIRMGQLAKNHKISHVKKDIARVMTLRVATLQSQKARGVSL
ncbi:MAG: 50S ribosomal protein L29 [Deltaproteobacteria bacterium]|nr:50S ribosomal protein L29 [Deltaproteobacteria bacterium]